MKLKKGAKVTWIENHQIKGWGRVVADEIDLDGFVLVIVDGPLVPPNQPRPVVCCDTVRLTVTG